jgi:hypothetical protein
VTLKNGNPLPSFMNFVASMHKLNIKATSFDDVGYYQVIVDAWIPGRMYYNKQAIINVTVLANKYPPRFLSQLPLKLQVK